MVNAWGVVSTGLWVTGLALVLAVLGRAHWDAANERERLGAVLARRDVRRALLAGATLASVGLACASRTWWERVVWILAAVWSGLTIWRGSHRKA